jgi:adenylate kinase family enzyme
VARRIDVVGVSGNGKTTLARRLAAKRFERLPGLVVVRLRSPREMERWLECQAAD